MTDKEAYELLVKYGGEKSIVLIKDMIHIAGVEKALENIEWSYRKNGHTFDENVRAWIRQALNYLVNTIQQSN